MAGNPSCRFIKMVNMEDGKLFLVLKCKEAVHSLIVSRNYDTNKQGCKLQFIHCARESHTAHEHVLSKLMMTILHFVLRSLQFCIFQWELKRHKSHLAHALAWTRMIKNLFERSQVKYFLYCRLKWIYTLKHI